MLPWFTLSFLQYLDAEDAQHLMAEAAIGNKHNKDDDWPQNDYQQNILLVNLHKKSRPEVDRLPLKAPGAGARIGTKYESLKPSTNKYFLLRIRIISRNYFKNSFLSDVLLS